MRDPGGHRNVLYVDCVSVNSLAGVLDCSFTKCCSWKKQKSPTISTYFFYKACEAKISKLKVQFFKESVMIFALPVPESS